MADTSRPEFVDCLESSQLLSEAQVRLLRQQLEGNPLTAEGLAQVLVRQEHLTRWQATQLLKGQTGLVLNHYRLLNPVGRGGMGHVFRALNSETDEVVAVKVMARKLTSNQTLVSRFRREIRASSQLDSPNIVRTLDAGRVGNIDFMVMEFVNGDQVDRIANRIGRLTVPAACEIVRQAADGLQHAHDRKMVHRDIKPANIMIHWSESGAGIVKLMDMGLVMLMTESGLETTVTRAGQVMGTPDYMSPEQGWDTTQVDIRSDIYSLGCTLFRLLTGVVPFSGSNPLQVLSQRLQRDAPSVSSVCSDLPADLADIVSRMTARDPDARYQEPSEVAAALAAFSGPITKDGLKTQIQQNPDPPDEGEQETEPSAEADGTYRQFLSEVQNGGPVDLMLGTNPDDSPLAATVPELRINVDSESFPAAKSARPRRGQKFSIALLVILTATVAGLAAAMLIDWRPASQPETAAGPIPTASIALEPPPIARTGSSWTHQVGFELGGNPQEFECRLGSDAPAGVRLDYPEGLLSWDVPEDLEPAEYLIPVEIVHTVDQRELVLSREELSVSVRHGFSAFQLPMFSSPLRLGSGQDFKLDLLTDAKDYEGVDLRFELVDPPRGVLLDRTAGLLAWKPSVRDLGHHSIKIRVSSGEGSDDAITGTLPCLVVPKDIRELLGDLPSLTAIAGTTFQYEFPEPTLSGNVRIHFRTTRQAPSESRIDNETGKLVWAIPSDAEGSRRIPIEAVLTAALLSEEVRIPGAMTLRIHIEDPPPEPLSESDVETASRDLRRTFATLISHARTASDRAELAYQLLEGTYGADPGVPDAALLMLVEEELASRSRATDVLFEIGRIRAERYGHDPLQDVSAALDLFRRTTLTPRRTDLMLEHCVRLSKLAADADDFSLTTKLLRAAVTLSGRSEEGPAAELFNDLNAAQRIAADLTRNPESEVTQVKSAELVRLLNRWQFEPIFADRTRYAYLQFARTGQPRVEGNGRDLWQLTDRRILLQSESRENFVGIIDREQALSRYVLRFELAPKSNCAHLLFSVTGTSETDFNAVKVNLNSSGFGRIQGLRNSVDLHDPASLKTALSTGSSASLVELTVDGESVVLTVNGSMISQAKIASLDAGKIGFMADLSRVMPSIEIRRPRLLHLPEDTAR